MSASGWDQRREFRRWLASLDEDLRREVPHDLLELSDEELADCDACQAFLETFRATVETCRSAPRPRPEGTSFREAAEAAREELRRKGVL